MVSLHHGALYRSLIYSALRQNSDSSMAVATEALRLSQVCPTLGIIRRWVTLAAISGDMPLLSLPITSMPLCFDNSERYMFSPPSMPPYIGMFS